MSGNVDDQSVVSKGWAIDFSSADLRCALDLFVFDKKVATFFTGNADRPDVVSNVLKGQLTDEIDLRHGFSINLSPFLLPGNNDIKIRFNKNGELIGGGHYNVRFSSYNISPVSGENGYVFYRNDSNNSMDQFLGASGCSIESINSYCQGIASLEKILGSNSIDFCSAIVPDRVCVIPQFVGNGFELSDTRPVKILEKRAKELSVNSLYLLDAVSKIDVEDACPKSDSHLGEYANYVMTKEIVAHFFKTGSNHLDESLEWKNEEFEGDLSKIFSMNHKEIMKSPSFKDSSVEIFDTMKTRPGSGFSGNAAAYINSSAPKGSAIIYGTSSSRLMSKYFNRIYGLVVHVWSNDLDIDMINLVKPNAVIVITAEKTVHNDQMKIFEKTASHVEKKIEAAFAMYKKLNS